MKYSYIRGEQRFGAHRSSLSLRLGWVKLRARHIFLCFEKSLKNEIFFGNLKEQTVQIFFADFGEIRLRFWVSGSGCFATRPRPRHGLDADRLVLLLFASLKDMSAQLFGFSFFRLEVTFVRASANLMDSLWQGMPRRVQGEKTSMFPLRVGRKRLWLLVFLFGIFRGAVFELSSSLRKDAETLWPRS